MAASKRRIPEGHHTITPHLVIKGAAKAMDFYKKAFGAEEHYRMPGPDGNIMHAEMQVGNSIFYLADEFPGMGCLGPQGGASPVTIHLYVEDADAAYKRAVDAGAKSTMPLQDMFWGDRYGKLVDPFGHHWSIASHMEDLTPQEIGQRAAAAFGGKGCGA